MSQNPFHHSQFHPGAPNFRFYLAALAHDALRQLQAVTRRLDSIQAVARRARERVTSKRSGPASVAAPTTPSDLENELAEISEQARKGKASGEKAGELLSRVSRAVEAADVFAVEGAGLEDCIVQLHSVEVRRRYNPDGKPARHWDVLFNGIPFRIPGCEAALLEVLAADDGESLDEYVRFKPKDELVRRLGVLPTTVSTRVHRLRKFLEDDPRLSPHFVETKGSAYRIRVLRRGATATNAQI